MFFMGKLQVWSLSHQGIVLQVGDWYNQLSVITANQMVILIKHGSQVIRQQLPMEQSKEY